MVLRRSSGAAENAALASGEYRSALFERFTGVLSRIGPEAAVLDLGPTTPSNITFGPSAAIEFLRLAWRRASRTWQRARPRRNRIRRNNLLERADVVV